jgi:SAM-dependent methyltransferase
VQARGEGIPQDRNFDYVFSIGVLHHIPDPAPVVRAAFGALRPGGKMLIWLYGREGNEGYLWWVLPLRQITRRLPDPLLAAFCRVLNLLLTPYIWLCRFLPLPMRTYMRAHLAKLSWEARCLTLFDQLNPAEARYYRENEARDLLEKAGFQDVRLYRRHGYSWTVIGTRPAGTAQPPASGRG